MQNVLLLPMQGINNTRTHLRSYISLKVAFKIIGVHLHINTKLRLHLYMIIKMNFIRSFV